MRGRLPAAAVLLAIVLAALVATAPLAAVILVLMAVCAACGLLELRRLSGYTAVLLLVLAQCVQTLA